jgi:hypothetical protein
VTVGVANPLERTYAVIEAAIGRPLRDAEKAIDVLRLDSALERAKDELDQAITREMLRATRAWVAAARLGTPTLTLTPQMVKPLEELHRLGREEAALELLRLGYPDRDVMRPDARSRSRRYAAPDPDPGGDLNEALATVRAGLPGIAIRIEDELVAADLTEASSSALAHALLRVPGARDLASRVVSTALTSGFAETFERNSDLIDEWEYTAILDGGTCVVCAPLDGTRYPTLDALFRVLPNFGPNPLCHGRGRCRCRAVPASV